MAASGRSSGCLTCSPTSRPRGREEQPRVRASNARPSLLAAGEWRWCNSPAPGRRGGVEASGARSPLLTVDNGQPLLPRQTLPCSGFSPLLWLVSGDGATPERGGVTNGAREAFSALSWPWMLRALPLAATSSSPPWPLLSTAHRSSGRGGAPPYVGGCRRPLPHLWWQRDASARRSRRSSLWPRQSSRARRGAAELAPIVSIPSWSPSPSPEREHREKACG
jgi:hypothetical protein